MSKGYTIMAAQAIVAPFLATFKEFRLVRKRRRSRLMMLWRKWPQAPPEVKRPRALPERR
jgi:hypothetical protein